MTTMPAAGRGRRLATADGNATPQDERCPERELWLNVILVALKDAGTGPLPAFPGHGRNKDRAVQQHNDMLEARAFLLNTSGPWCAARENACDLAAINPDYLRRIALERIGPENARSQQPASAATTPATTDGSTGPCGPRPKPVLGARAASVLPAITAALAAFGRPASATEVAAHMGVEKNSVGLILKNAHARGAGGLVRLPPPRGEGSGPPLWALDPDPAAAGTAPAPGEAGLVRIPAARPNDPPSWTLAGADNDTAAQPSPSLSTALAA